MSDSDHGDLDLEALKSIFGSNAFDDLPDANEKHEKIPSNKTKKKSSKKTQKQKKSVINLDELLDGINIDSIPNNDIDLDTLDSIPQKKDKSNQDMKNFGNNIFSFQTTTDAFTNFEEKIENYLDLTIRTVQSEVIKEIEQILVDTDNFDDIIVDFLEKLNHSIYEIIIFGKSEVTENQSMHYSIFEDFSNLFLESFRKIGEFSQRYTCRSTNIIKSCKNLIETKKPIFEQQMRNAVHDINHEINELNKVRSQDLTLGNENKKKIRSYFHKHALLEGKIRALDEMNENMVKKIEQLQELRNQSFLYSTKKFPDDDTTFKYITKASHYFKNTFLKKKARDNGLVKAKIDKVFFACEDLMTSIDQAEFTLTMITNSFSRDQTIQPILKSIEINPKSQNKSKVIEESKNGLIEYKTQREAQYKTINDTINKFRKRSETQSDE